MAAYFIVGVNIPDPQNRGAYDEYIARVKPVVENAGGRYQVRSEKVQVMAGSWKPDRVIVVEFDSKEALEACFSSAEYRAIAPLREDTVHTSAVVVEE